MCVCVYKRFVFSFVLGMMLFPKARRRVLQRRWLSLKSRRYMDDVMDGVMDDVRMDSVMVLVGFSS